ncbi:hypothetical protein CRU94_04550 [Arcobacter sp. AHV-9/2010]|uniref:glycosyltransferase n=1 Tax=Arcobacter sp. AHV-9/2010 TaxID=2021861 RepID=UPI00100B199B|nr:glycosyltransferase [Arcobacter sp. CECT 9299]RXJ95887.1 hypothetical protein CRU94_04550 [Arcobacter sp. CECT 9299]
MFKTLISTMDDKFLNRKLALPFNHLIINQLVNKQTSDYQQDNLISVMEKGLSKSRNRALEHCTSDIALISDDDVEYVDDLEYIILKAFKENPDADIITFQVKTPDGEFFKDNYKDKSFYHNQKTIMRVSSVEIAFRVDKIKKNCIKFDEDFGLGTNYPTGEEAILLSDALKKGLKILYIPLPIVIHPKESSGGMFKNNPKLLEAKGAMFFRIFGLSGYFISFLFAIKKYKMSNNSLLGFYKLMLQGIKEYKETNAK